MRLVQSITIICFSCLMLMAKSQNPPASGNKAKKSEFSQAHTDPAADAAQAGLKLLRQSITKDNFKQFGFASLDEVAKMQVGSGIPLYYVRADQLKSYSPGTDAGAIMIPTNRRVYSVTVDGVGRLIMTIKRDDDGWKLVSFDKQDIAASLAKIKSDKLSHAAGPSGSPENYFALEIPSMHLTFLGFAPPIGPAGASETKRHVSLTALETPQVMSKTIGNAGCQFLTMNPNFTPAKAGSKSANDVLQSLVPQAAKVAAADAPQ